MKGLRLRILVLWLVREHILYRSLPCPTPQHVEDRAGLASRQVDLRAEDRTCWQALGLPAAASGWSNAATLEFFLVQQALREGEQRHNAVALGEKGVREPRRAAAAPRRQRKTAAALPSTLCPQCSTVEPTLPAVTKLNPRRGHACPLLLSSPTSLLTT